MDPNKQPSLGPPPTSADSENRGGHRNILYKPQDPTVLSEPLCLLRAQIEAFAATPEDVKARLRAGGKKISVGRVGIRCVHCAHVPPPQRARGSSSYPRSTKIVHQSVRNFQRYHFDACDRIPAGIKEKFRDLQTKRHAQSKKESARYWIECCERMGMVDTDDDNGILFEADSCAGKKYVYDDVEVAGATKRAVSTSPAHQSSGGSRSTESEQPTFGTGDEANAQLGDGILLADDGFVGIKDEVVGVVDGGEIGEIDANDWEHFIQDSNLAPYTEQISLDATNGEPLIDPVPILPNADQTPAVLLATDDADTTTDEGAIIDIGKGFDEEAPEAACSSATDRTDSDGFVHSADIRSSDVLFGPCPRVHDHVGNVSFRSLVDTRKSEYRGSNSCKEKNRIAVDIVNHVRCNSDPPGRFLAMVKKAVTKSERFAKNVEIWCLADDKTAQEKVKQSLRQQREGAGGSQRKRPAWPAARQQADPLVSKDYRGSVENVTRHAISDIDSSVCISSTNVDQISIDNELNEWTSSIDFSRKSATGEDETSLDMYSMSSSEGSVVAAAAGVPRVVVTADETLFSDQLNTRTMMPFVRPTSVERGMAASDVMKKAGRNRENGDESALDERTSLLESVRLASELVKKIRDGQELGAVAYGSNIDVDGLGLSGERIRRDLVSLGFNLYRHFASVDPLDESRDSGSGVKEATAALEESSISRAIQVKKKERRSTSRRYVLLRDMGFPVSLCILVSSLLDAEDEGVADRYRTAEEVEEDLSLMMVNPERYLFDASADTLRGQLVFPGDRLYGREDHIFRLMEVFNRVTGSCNRPREMLLISGYSGTGKSALVEQLRGPLLRKNGYFVSGTFEQLGQAQPMSVIFDAFNEYCNTIAEGSDDPRARIRRAIKDVLGSNWNVIAARIPNLSKLIGEPAAEAVQVGGREALNRFLFYFRLFVKAISSTSHAVVLFLDDLQWADTASLELISAIVSDCEITSLLFVGCYRDNEVGKDHPLHKEAGKLALAGVSISRIYLENIDRRSIIGLVSDTLHLSPRLTWSLGDIVYNKTSGNPLFAVQFLRSLYDDRLLRYSASSRRWEWDVDAIQSKDIADNVVDLMTRKILKLHPEVQWLLKVAACLGSRFEHSMLKVLGSDTTSDEWDTIFVLDTSIREGLMSKLGSVYKFSHDQIQQAAYSLVPFHEREAFHLRIGRSLWKRTPKEELGGVIFVVVDQLQRGLSLISDHDEKVEVARLCLTAGEKAMSSSAFSHASIYLLQGSVLLQESDWEDHYDLSLRLFSCCAEAQYALGNYELLTIAVTPIFTHGKCLQDKLWAIYNHIRSIGGQGKQLDAVVFGLDILAQLGEPFPSEENQETAKKLEFAKTQVMCEGVTTDEILKKEKMHDPSKVAAMKVLVLLIRYAFKVNQHLCSLMIYRLVQLTMRHGYCPESPFAFSSFGLTCCSIGQLKQGCRYGKLALSLLETLKAKEQLARVYMSISMINPFSEPLQAIIPSLAHGYEAGMATGDIEYGLINAGRSFYMASIQCGNKLEPLVEEGRKCVQLMKDYKQKTVVMIVPILQTLLNLIGDSEDPTKLTGEAMDQDDFLKSALDHQSASVVNLVNFMRLWLAYLFRRSDVAAEMAERHREISKTAPRSLEKVVDQTFYIGLIAMERVRGGEVKEWKSFASESLEKMKVWADNSAWNFQHKLDLLNAEMAYCNGDRDEAADAYDNAIRAAGEHGFIHEQALACERAGIFYSETIGEFIAAEYFERAKKYYLEWGATRKVRDMSTGHVGKKNSVL